MMDAIEKLLFVSEEAKKWIYHPMMKKVKHHTLHQYRRELSTSGNQILALIPHELPISMNALPSSRHSSGITFEPRLTFFVA